MSVMQIYHGRPHSPYFVFVEKTGYNASDLLSQLGLGSYIEVKTTTLGDNYLCIGADDQWTHLADDYCYSHWHSQAYRSHVASLAKGVDIFSFSIGDIDLSFDLERWRNGKLVRRLVWEDPRIDGGNLKEEFGEPLEGESEIPRGSDPHEGLWYVAELLGIETDYTKLNLRAFAPKRGLSQRIRAKLTGA